MKFRGVIVDLVQMNRRRFVVRRDRHIPLSGERAADVGFDSVQHFLRRLLVKSNKDTVLAHIQPYLLYIRVRFDQPYHSRPGVSGPFCGFHIWDPHARHWFIHGETPYLAFLENNHDVRALASSATACAADSE
jgi:hypothetical protein